ncbi:LOB domain-containing protein 1 [Sesamum alatum]|uniref:LOB domain-containing protein 1 n=1 Tax=Sesamum alatum TaxID=300844 RepID=A0AAE2CVH7_9LAMI|nr:LOB domain-containing protein 1 [Sesamum alatum]
MEYRKTTTAAAARLSSVSPTSSASSGNPSSLPHPPPQPVILSPCAACKILRRRCVDNCLLAPYFPPTEPLKFTTAHRVFGASNIIKLLQSQRADAVNSMVYEANARLRDPVYGCTGMVCHLQNQVSELQAEVAKAQAEILNMQCQNAGLIDLLCKGMVTQTSVEENLPYDHNSTFFSDEPNVGVSWEHLWT